MGKISERVEYALPKSTVSGLFRGRDRYDVSSGKAISVSALILGAIHCRVGILYKGVPIASVLGEKADADAHADSKFVMLKNDWPSEGFDYLLGDTDSLLRSIEIRQENDELISAQSRYSVLVTTATYP